VTALVARPVAVDGPSQRPGRPWHLSSFAREGNHTRATPQQDVQPVEPEVVVEDVVPGVDDDIAVTAGRRLVERGLKGSWVLT
jgi:hypothetical protein